MKNNPNSNEKFNDLGNQIVNSQRDPKGKGRPIEEAIKEAIAEGFDINSQDADGNTLLHLVLRSEQTEAALILIQNGADGDVVNNSNQAARQIINQGNNDILKEAIKNQQPKNITTQDQSSSSASTIYNDMPTTPRNDLVGQDEASSSSSVIHNIPRNDLVGQGEESYITPPATPRGNIASSSSIDETPRTPEGHVVSLSSVNEALSKNSTPSGYRTPTGQGIKYDEHSSEIKAALEEVYKHYRDLELSGEGFTFGDCALSDCSSEKSFKSVNSLSPTRSRAPDSKDLGGFDKK